MQEHVKIYLTSKKKKYYLGRNANDMFKKF